MFILKSSQDGNMAAQKPTPIRRFDLGKTAEELVPDFTNRFAYLLALVVTLLEAGWLWWLLPRLPRVVPLYFTEPWGEAELAPKLFFFLLPGVSFVVIVINIVVSRLFSRVSAIVPRILSIAAATLSLMFLFALAGVIQSLFL